MKILFLTAEAAPFAKTGGLGDVCGSLPKALSELGHDVRVAMPAYQFIESAYQTGRWNLKALPFSLNVPTGSGIVPAGVFEGVLPGSRVPIYFIAERSLFDRPKIYGYDDDPYRFVFFSRAGLDLIAALDWYPDVVHAHDWHSAPALLWLATAGKSDGRYQNIATLFTIHNLAHQGRSSWNLVPYLGVHATPLRDEAAGEVNFMARGIYHATMINTVSPTYAREIMTPQGGVGLDALLRFRHYDVHGILNGLDYGEWNPEGDPHIARHFNANQLDERAENKMRLQSSIGVPQDPDVPLVSMITRLAGQKGLDIVGHVIHLLLNGLAGDAQFVVLGTGEKKYEDMMRHLANYHAVRMSAILGYAADLAPLIYAGSDIFLMPSLFEPCGLGQLIAMRYGAVPVVRATGGLADTVHDGDRKSVV